MDNGDIGDNLRQTYANALEEGGFSKTVALWITDAGMRAAEAGFGAMDSALNTAFEGTPPANVVYVCIGVMEARLAVMRKYLDFVVEQSGRQTVETYVTVPAVEIIPADRGTVQ